MINHVVLIPLFIFLFTHPAYANQDSKIEAEVLLNLLNLDSILAKSIDEGLHLILEQEESVEPYLNVIEEFFGMHLGYENIKPQMIEMYSERFTAAELREMIHFYQSPIGTKFIEETPELMSRVIKIELLKITENIQELEFMIEVESDRILKLQEKLGTGQ